MDQLGRMTPEDFKKAPKTPIVAVLDNIRSMNNVGSVFRTADAFLLEAVYLCGYTPKPPHRDIHKTALGATETVRWDYFDSTDNAIQSLKKARYKIYSVEQATSSIALDKLELPAGQKVALIFGNEVEGVQQSIIDQSDGCLEIPQFGTKHSLNISIAAGIVIWEVSKQLNSLLTGNP